jgi:hypothetical protein
METTYTEIQRRVVQEVIPEVMGTGTIFKPLTWRNKGILPLHGRYRSRTSLRPSWENGD